MFLLYIIIIKATKKSKSQKKVFCKHWLLGNTILLA